MPLTLRKMYSVTPANIRKNSRAANTQIRTRGRLKKYARLGDVYEIIYKVKCTKEWRNVTLRFMKKSPNDPMPSPSLTAPCWVRCTCPWFLYHCEYALSRSGSTWLHYSNGEPANQTNPQNIPFVCKHIYAVQAEIKAFKPEEAPFRQPRRKVLPENTFKNLQNTETTKTRNVVDKLTRPIPPEPTPVEPELTPAQQRVKDEAIENIEELQQAAESPPPGDKSVTDKILDRVNKTLTEIIDRMETSDTPIADQAAHEVKQIVRDVKNRGQKALTDNAIVRKLDKLIKRFRGF